MLRTGYTVELSTNIHEVLKDDKPNITIML